MRAGFSPLDEISADVSKILNKREENYPSEIRMRRKNYVIDMGLYVLMCSYIDSECYERAWNES